MLIEITNQENMVALNVKQFIFNIKEMKMSKSKSSIWKPDECALLVIDYQTEMMDGLKPLKKKW